MTARVLAPTDPAAAERFAEHGWVRTTAPDAPGARVLRAWADEVGALDPAVGVLHYDEETAHGPARCRSEHFVGTHPGFTDWLTGPAMLAAAGALLGEPAALYKEKINYKLPGGAGYAPHQDAPAYRFVEHHVSCLVAIDDATPDNGGLEVVSGAHDRIWPQDERGCIAPDVVAGWVWEPVTVVAGDVLWFHSRTPHRSGPNRSDRPRRACYPTYHAAGEGDLRAAYYAQKAVEFAAEDGDPDRVRVSLIGDFEGRIVR